MQTIDFVSIINAHTRNATCVRSHRRAFRRAQRVVRACVTTCDAYMRVRASFTFDARASRNVIARNVITRRVRHDVATMHHYVFAR